MSIAQWIFLSELDQARQLYFDAYKQMHGVDSPVIDSKCWNDIDCLATKTDELILQWVMGDSLEAPRSLN